MPRNIVRSQRVDREKLERAREFRRSMTEGERLLWQALRNNALHGLHFRRQQVIDGFIVDFYCHDAALVVEVDGSVHDERTDYDEERDQILSARGLSVMRVADEDVRARLPSVLARIQARALERRAAAGGEFVDARSPAPHRQTGDNTLDERP